MGIGTQLRWEFGVEGYVSVSSLWSCMSWYWFNCHCIWSTASSADRLFVCVLEPLRISVSYSLSEGHLMANCSASAWPRPTITWLGLENQNKKTEEKVSDLNGTVLVTSHLYINNSESLVGHNLTCRASSMDEDKTSSVKVEGQCVIRAIRC